MSRVGFFTPLINHYNPKFQDKCGRVADGYFNFGKLTAYKIPFENTGKNQVVDLFLEDRPFDPIDLIVRALSIATLIIPIILMVTKLSVRYTQKPLEPIASQSKVQEGVEISPKMLSAIQKLIPAALAKTNSPEILYYKNTDDHIFELTKYPGYVIKLSRYATSDPALAEKETRERYLNLINATAIIRVYGLSRLIVPHGKWISIERDRKYHVIIEKKLNLQECSGATIPENRKFVLINPKKQVFYPLLTKDGLKQVDPKEEELAIFEKARKLGYGYLNG